MWGRTRVAVERGRHPGDPPPGDGTDPEARGRLSVSDLLAKSGDRAGRRVAARQAVVQVRRHRIRRFFAVTVTMLVALLASAAAYYVGLFFYLDRSVDRVDALAVDAPGIISPEAQEAADNFLIVGTEGAGSEIRVTSALVAHLAPERDRAVLISLPLTAFVDVPACPRPGASVLDDPYGGSLASSFDVAGAGCLVRTVQQLSGMRMNHYVQLDVGRLPSMVDALGGVPVCLPADLRTGAEAAGHAAVLDADRIRAILADAEATQDPTGRLATDRQRLLLASTLREALRPVNLVNPVAVTGFVSEVANGLTLDPGTTLGELKDLGDKLGKFTERDTVQTSVPLDQVGYRPAGSARSYALIDHASSRAMFAAVISDADLPDPAVPADPTDAALAQGGEAEPAAPPAPPPPAPEPLTVAPQQITVNVFNGIGTPGMATGAAAQLAGQGFVIAAVENQITGAVESVVRYPPGQFEAARTVAAAVPDSVLLEGVTTGGVIDVVLGSSFTGVVPVLIPPPTPTETAATGTAESTPAPTPTPTGSADERPCG